MAKQTDPADEASSTVSSSDPTTTPTAIGDDPSYGGPDQAAADTLAELEPEAPSAAEAAPPALEDEWRGRLRSLLGALNDALKREGDDDDPIVDEEGRIRWAMSESRLTAVVDAGARLAVEEGLEPPKAIGGRMGLAIAVAPHLVPRLVLWGRLSSATEVQVVPVDTIGDDVPMQAAPNPAMTPDS